MGRAGPLPSLVMPQVDLEAFSLRATLNLVSRFHVG